MIGRLAVRPRRSVAVTNSLTPLGEAAAIAASSPRDPAVMRSSSALREPTVTVYRVLASFRARCVAPRGSVSCTLPRQAPPTGPEQASLILTAEPRRVALELRIATRSFGLPLGVPPLEPPAPVVPVPVVPLPVVPVPVVPVREVPVPVVPVPLVPGPVVLAPVVPVPVVPVPVVPVPPDPPDPPPLVPPPLAGEITIESWRVASP